MTKRQPPQLLPSAADILRCVREVTHDLLAPSLTGHAERSAAATIDHMLRYVERLLDHQGQSLLDEEQRLQALLPKAADWLAGRDAALAQTIRADCTATPDSTIYPTLAMMEDRVALLRQHVCDTLTALHAEGAAKGTDGEALHDMLRDYIRWQIAREGELVEPAFLGHGPRR
ncbi:MAG TPA: hypothetical protein VFL92_13460 [Sphingomonas sp.]|nr:hypothetical protein [Sphingomonas sp.]